MKVSKITALISGMAVIAGTFSSMPVDAVGNTSAVAVKQVLADSTLIPSGAVYTITNIKSQKLLNVDEDGNVCQREASGTDAQQWKIVAASDGYCKIISMQNTNKVLTIDDAATPNGSNISVSDDVNAETQLFKIHTEGSDFYITTKCSGDVSAIDIKGKSNAEGANVHQYKYQGNPNQIFSIVPVADTYTWIRGDLDFDNRLSAFDMCLMRKGLTGGFDDIASGIADLNGNGKADVSDAVILQNFLLGKETEFASPYYTMPYTPPVIPTPVTDGRLMEYLDRGVVAVRSGNNVFVSWRSLATDSPDTAFNLYRVTDGKEVKLNSEPLTGGTNFTDTKADVTKENKYYVKTVINGKEADTDGSYTMPANKGSGAYITVPIKDGGNIHFVWVGDFNGDGAYDFLVDRNADDHQKLEAYLNDGTYLWTIDMGYNSENKNNISPGASTIDVGMWDGATVYDMDCDGYADVCLRIADGVAFGDGQVYSDKSHANAQAIAVIDGRTGKLKASVPTPTDFINVGPLACMMEIGYLDGKTPSVVCWMKNRNKDKTFNSMTVAYGYENGNFVQHWKYINTGIFPERNEYINGYAEAHQIRVADVDYDGKDEVLHMGYCLNGDGSLRWHNDEIVHGDRWFVGSFENANNGNVMMGYGIQQDHPRNLLEYYYNASTGEIVWSHYDPNGNGQIDVARGNVGDLDPNYEGLEMYSFQGMNTIDDKMISTTTPYPCFRIFWNGDLFSDSYNDGKIESWNYKTQGTDRLASTWKIYASSGSDRGVGMFHGDILGDWREESILANYDTDELVIYTTDVPTDHRIYSLAQNPCYRNCMTAKGYYQSNMLDYFLGYNMEEPKTPDISIIQK